MRGGGRRWDAGLGAGGWGHTDFCFLLSDWEESVGRGKEASNLFVTAGHSGVLEVRDRR